MPLKPFMLTLSEEDIVWVGKSSKEMRVKRTEFMRIIINYVKDHEIAEIKKTVAKGKLEQNLKEINEKEEAITKEKAHLQKELEKLGA